MCPCRRVPDDVSLVVSSWIFRPLYIPPHGRWVLTDVSDPDHRPQGSSSALGCAVMMHVRPNAVAIRYVLGAPYPQCAPFLSTRRIYCSYMFNNQGRLDDRLLHSKNKIETKSVG